MLLADALHRLFGARLFVVTAAEAFKAELFDAVVEAGHGDAQPAHGAAGGIALAEERKSRLGDLAAQCRGAHLLLPGIVLHLFIAHPQMHGVRLAKAGGTLAGSDAFAEHIDEPLDVADAVDVFKIGEGIAHLFEGFPLARRTHGRGIFSAGIGGEGGAPLAEVIAQKAGICRRQGADGGDAHLLQPLRRRPADIQKVGDGEREDLFAEVLAVHHRDGVRLFEVGGELGEHFIEADPHRNGEAELRFDGGADAFGDLFSAAEDGTAGDVKPAFVHAEGLDLIGEAGVDLPARPRIAGVFRKARRTDDEAGALALRLPDDVARLDAARLRLFALGKNDAVAKFGVAADGDGLAGKFGEQFALDGGVKVVEIGMENDHIRVLCAA